MISVFKRELSSAFHRFYGYVTVAVPVLVSAFLLMVYNLMYTAEDTVSVFAAMSIVIALVIPIVAVNSFPSRKKTDTDAVYDMLPVSSRDVVIGKYLAAYAQLLISTLIMALYPIFAGFFGTLDTKASYSVVLAYLLFEAAWLAVCMFIAAVSKSRVIAYILCYAVAVVWYFAGIVNVLIPVSPVASLVGFAIIALSIGALLWLITKKAAFGVAVAAVLGVALAVSYVLVPEGFAGLLETFIDKISIFRQFDSFAYGIFDLEGILFFLLLICVFLFLAYRIYELKFESVREKPTLRIRKVTSVMLAVVIIAASLAVNVAAGILPDRFTSFDATAAQKNSVSKEAREYLSGIDKAVTISILEPTGDEAYEMYLERISACSDLIMFQKVYYSNTPEFYEELGISVSSISANSLIVSCEDTERFNYITYIDMIVYSNEEFGLTEMGYQEYQYYYSMFSSNESYADYLTSLLYNTTVYFNGDAMICSSIEYVTKDIIPASYYLTGHGEVDIESATNPYSGYFEPIDISDGGSIPEDAACVLINLPTEDISETEKTELLAYLARGGQITVLTNEANLDMTNLCAVLAEYGMSAQKGTVTDLISDEDNETDTPTTDITAQINGDNDIMYYLVDAGVNIVVSDANAIKLDGTSKDTLVHYPLLTSSEKSYIGDNSSTSASYTLACAAETADGARLVWFTGGESYQDGTANEVYAVMYATTWVTLEYTTQVEDVPAAVYALPTAEITSGGARLIAVMLILLPIAFVVFGAVTVYVRKKSK